jgi:hypothetical protein
MMFPKTDNNKVDTIIRSCWHGKYTSIKRLLAIVKLLDGVNSSRLVMIMEEDYKVR